MERAKAEALDSRRWSLPGTMIEADIGRGIVQRRQEDVRTSTPPRRVLAEPREP